MRTLFPTVNGKIENIELIPTSMTIVTPWRGEPGESGLQLDILPMIKIGLYHLVLPVNSFTMLKAWKR